MPCQHVTAIQLATLIERLRHAHLDDDERARHEKFLLQCVPHPEALAFIRAPEQHPANPHPGQTPDAGETARILIAMR